MLERGDADTQRQPEVGRAGRASLGYQVGGDVAPATLHRGRDREQGLQLGRHGGVVRVGPDLLD